jgi:large subunit ribosomal protein L25
MITTLEVSPRDAKASTDTLRAKGSVPAVFYGPKENATPITIDGRKLAAIWKEAGETTIITLKGAGEDKETLIKDVQFDAVTGGLVHADFYVLEKGKKIEINIPLSFDGVSPAEKAGHVLVKALHEIEIEVAPAELPHSLSVDLSTLHNVGDHITAAQIVLPPSATLITEARDVVASITAVVEEKEEKPAVAEIVDPAESAATAAVPAEGEKEKKE